MKLLKRLRGYQDTIVQWGSMMTHFGLQVDMRLGKNLICIRIIQLWYKLWGVIGPVLIVCPFSAFDGWEEDIHGEAQMYRIHFLEGTAKRRLKILDDNFKQNKLSFFIINKEGWRACPHIRERNWFCVILDESRFIAAQNKASKFFLRNFRSVKHRIELSGTMDYKNKMDYYNQIAFLNPGYLPYKNFWDFRTKAFMAKGYDWIMRSKHHDILTKCLSKHFYTLRRKEVKLGRKKTYLTRRIRLDKKTRKLYDTTEELFILENNGVFKSTIYATTKAIYLQRMCGGFAGDDFIYDGKYNALNDLLDNEFRGEQVVICCRYKQEINFLFEKFNQRGFRCAIINGDVKRKDRKNVKKLFMEKLTQLLFCEAGVIARGTDLKIAHTMIFYSQPNGKEVRDQVEDRIITLDDEDECIIMDIIVKDTVDEDTRIDTTAERFKKQIFERAIKKWNK